MEKIFMRLQVLKADASQSLSGFFQNKVQLEEQMKENEVQIQFHRGVIAALEQVCKEIIKICGSEQKERDVDRLLNTAMTQDKDKSMTL